MNLNIIPLFGVIFIANFQMMEDIIYNYSTFIFAFIGTREHICEPFFRYNSILTENEKIKRYNNFNKNLKKKIKIIK